MNSAIRWKLALLTFLIFVVPFALAQKQAAPKYDLQNEIKVKGTVEEVKSIGTHEPKETHLMLKTDKGVLLEICLCPSKFLTEMEINFVKGDKIEVTGAKAKDTIDGSEVVQAREIVKDQSTIVLRDKEGNPVWTWLVK